MKDEIRSRPAPSRRRTTAGRGAAAAQGPRAASASMTTASAVESQGSTNVRSSANASARGVGFSVQHLAAGEILARLRTERGQVGIQSAAGDEHRNAPQQTANREHHAAADHARRRLRGRSDRQARVTSSGSGEPHRLRSQADADGGEERTDHDHAARRPPSSPAPAGDRPSRTAFAATTQSTSTPATPARPPGPADRSSGATARYQNSGQVTVMAVAESAATVES